MRTKVAIIGSGNIGTDLLYKTLRSDLIEPVWMVGIDPSSEGLERARDRGLRTADDGLGPVLALMKEEGVQIAFDATSARAHESNGQKLKQAGILAIDLTPAAIGPYCVPPVNLRDHVGKNEMNVNLVSCGGQATIPIVAAVSRIQPVEYAEIVATVASRSIGPGTRQNIDEFTRTTASGVEKTGGARKGKAIIVINPADPPIMMRDTVHVLTEDDPNQDEISESVREMVCEVQKYVPGYRLKNGPVFDGRRISTYLEVAGLGDFLPKFAGNLDIMTAAALRTGELFAEEIQSGRLVLSGSEA